MKPFRMLVARSMTCVAATLLMITAGCAATSPSASDAGSFVGMRMDEVVRRLGPPFRTLPLDNGEKIFIYTDRGQPSYTFEFGVDRRVLRVSETR
jgi:hypothetical protein